MITNKFAFFKFNTFLAYSTAVICIPKQIPKNGILFSLTYFIVSIIPSIPRSPNPPGTTIASYFDNFSLTFSGLRYFLQ